jgi:BirA family transcriptional regulator, biotin operon repressor / biotin---[acetyl-CoA-carboxylase] ligase
MQFSPIAHTIVKLDEVDSTNNYAATLLNETKVVNGTVVLAKNQTQGKGQMGNVWIVEPNANLTFSILLTDLKLNANQQFLLSIWVSVALSESLKNHFNIPNVIKWPNDILCQNGKKIAGVLIENSVKGNKLSHSIIGIGLNVNQTTFPFVSNATSMANEIGTSLIIEDVFNSLVSSLNKHYLLLQQMDEKKLLAFYYANLLGYNSNLDFEDEHGKFTAKILGVTSIGQLVVQDTNEQTKIYNFKELKFIL